MGTLHYIVGQQIDGADMYNLYKRTYDGSTPVDEKIATRNCLQKFQHHGIMVDGKVKEELYSYTMGSGNKKATIPLRILTEEGVKYGVKFSGYVDIVGDGGWQTKRNFEGVYYVSQNQINSVGHVSFRVPKAVGEDENGKGYFLSVYVNDETTAERVYILDPMDDVAYVGFGKGHDGTVKIHSVAIGDNYGHTDFIRTDALTDNYSPTGTLDTVCVGPFNLNDDLDFDKMSFYNKNLKFIAGAKAKDLVGKSDYGEYFTADGVQAIAHTVTGITSTSDENYPRFVVFCSKVPNTIDQDRVSVGNIYFPLFDMPELNGKLTEGENILVVTADSSSPYYSESEPSLERKYTYTK